MLIKICGIKNPEIAAFAAQHGAHFIGMILTPGFSRSISIEQAKIIAEASYDHGAVPVGVFVSAQPEEIESACRELKIEYVQAYQLSLPLPKHLKRFFINDDKASLRPQCDYLLIESNHPGTEEKIDDQQFSFPQIRPWLIAGGLNPQNVKSTILRYRPDGVDVSSGVEKDGIKCPELIFQFIQEVKSHE